MCLEGRQERTNNVCLPDALGPQGISLGMGNVRDILHNTDVITNILKSIVHSRVGKLVSIIIICFLFCFVFLISPRCEQT